MAAIIIEADPMEAGRAAEFFLSNSSPVLGDAAEVTRDVRQPR